MKEYTREELIEICELAIVKEKDWCNRDSESSQRNVGICWALLKCGCDFEVKYEKEHENDMIVTDEDTIWLYIYSEGFDWFEWSADENDRTYKEKELIYLPTMRRIARARGGDWY